MRASEVQASETLPLKWSCRAAKATHTIPSARVNIGVAATETGSSPVIEALLGRAQLALMEHLNTRLSTPAGAITQCCINACEGQFSIAHLWEISPSKLPQPKQPGSILHRLLGQPQSGPDVFRCLSGPERASSSPNIGRMSTLACWQHPNRLPVHLLSSAIDSREFRTPSAAATGGHLGFAWRVAANSTGDRMRHFACPLRTLNKDKNCSRTAASPRLLPESVEVPFRRSFQCPFRA